VSAFVKQAGRLIDTAYWFASSLIKLFYKELSTFYYFTLLHHVNYVQKLRIYFYAILFMSSLVMVPCGLKHVATVSVIL